MDCLRQGPKTDFNWVKACENCEIESSHDIRGVSYHVSRTEQKGGSDRYSVRSRFKTYSVKIFLRSQIFTSDFDRQVQNAIPTISVKNYKHFSKQTTDPP